MNGRIEFSKDFVFGAATAAYQIEGAFNEDGKGLSIWDEFVRKKGKIKNNDTGDIACDHYHRYAEDVKIMQDLNLHAYRYSVSWPRVIPSGKGAVNEKGLDFYNRLTDELLKKNITPFVTLYHWDLPLELHRRGGWRNRDTSCAFAEYAELMTRKLGDRVKHWITLNEPWVAMVTGYVLGVHAPGERTPFSALRTAHNMLLAHGLALDAMRKSRSDLKIGLTNALSPVHSFRKDLTLKAEKKADAIVNRLWLDPIYHGKYPEIITKNVFSANKGNIKQDDLKIISGKTDFLGVNHYTRMLVRNFPFPLYSFLPVVPKYEGVKFTSMGWEIYPEGMSEILGMIREDYGNPPVYITENGVSFYEKPENGRIEDDNRIEYLKNYLFQCWTSVKKGSDLKGYFAWSLLDNLEWHYGFEKTFGLVHIDRNTLSRTPKKSAGWYADLCRNRGFDF